MIAKGFKAVKITGSIVGFAVLNALLAGAPAFAVDGKSTAAAKLAVSSARVVCEEDADRKTRLHDTVANTWGEACKIVVCEEDADRKTRWHDTVANTWGEACTIKGAAGSGLNLAVVLVAAAGPGGFVIAQGKPASP